MEISALVKSSHPDHEVVVRTDAAAQSLTVAAKAAGKGSAINGGEFLMLALATCYCNDLYREAERLRIPLESVEVEASAQFPVSDWPQRIFAIGQVCPRLPQPL
jgi:uncharacterized OsmC-like protein